ncbi:MAG: glycoside hydrolase family 13 [Gemmatimonadota bacterium]
MSMDERLQAYLDGEIDLEALPAELRAEAEAWNGLIAEVRATAPAAAPDGLEARVLRGIRAARATEGRRRRLAWLLEPRPFRVSPLAALAAAAVLVLVAVRPWSLGGASGGGEGLLPARVYVQFSVEAPGATSVDVVGDFTDWKPTVSLEDADGDGVWSARVPLAPGVHEYMFVLDGATWMTDPNAAGYADDGFGQQNAVLAIAEPLNGT